QTAYPRAQIRSAQRQLPRQFPFERDVVLLDAGLGEVKRNRVDRRLPTERTQCAAAERADPVRVQPPWPARERSRRRTGLRAPLVEGVGRDRIAHTLRGRCRVEDAVTAPNHALFRHAPCCAKTRRNIICVRIDPGIPGQATCESSSEPALSSLEQSADTLSLIFLDQHPASALRLVSVSLV